MTEQNGRQKRYVMLGVAVVSSLLLVLVVIIIFHTYLDQRKAKTQFVPNIEKIANDSLVYLTIECGVAATRITSGCIIAHELLATNNFCAVMNGREARMLFGSAIAARDGLEYRVESVVDVGRGLATVKVIGLGGPFLSIGNSDTVRRGDRVYIAVHPLQDSRGSMIGKVTRTPRSDIGDIEITAPHSFDDWRGGIVLNYKGELIAIVSTRGQFDATHGFAIPVNRLRRILGRGNTR